MPDVKNLLSKLFKSRREEGEEATVRRAEKAAQATEAQRLRLLQLELETLSRKGRR